ncbi:MAG: hypothetical protein AVDCRST_MAG67-999 [uncultured Solirubrobacteraceae bacterium]|uniref:Blue (type 1) copper domain-containing protein n=1 Tax=uncultured Solirubrobacteraceae bacterium TaxID=1162706 RepID=A0A6J4S3I6_9ACTN|nr:MAG: hypothetical protein AVDCRST_MAG67-999 [uncultured Solirubrobacteraceae bacterium]
MRTRRSTALRGALAAAAAAGLVAALGSGSPAAADAGAESTATAAKTISMRSAPAPRFSGSTSVASGQMLRVRNLSDPRQHGPHTFTLVTADVLPRGRKAGEQCFTPGKICLVGATAHEFDPKTEELKRQLVEAGAVGWDRRFSRTSRKGDSWYSEKKNEQFEQVVSARPGTVLRFMCLIHPEMQGKIRVTG